MNFCPARQTRLRQQEQNAVRHPRRALQALRGQTRAVPAAGRRAALLRAHPRDAAHLSRGQAGAGARPRDRAQKADGQGARGVESREGRGHSALAVHLLQAQRLPRDRPGVGPLRQQRVCRPRRRRQDSPRQRLQRLFAAQVPQRQQRDES